MFVLPAETATVRPTETASSPNPPAIIAPSENVPRVIATDSLLPSNIKLPSFGNLPLPTVTAERNPPQVTPQAKLPEGLSKSAAIAMGDFTKNWVPPGQARTGGTREREFVFTAYIGQYTGGNWNSTVQIANGKIWNGSLPNLLDFMHTWSKNNVKTNYQNVKAIKLDSDQLFAGDIETGGPPPFIFMTGTRDFTLTEKEVANLQKYVRLGGAIWGDSSVPGHNSRFDIAFRREMKRVIPDVDKPWEALPANHPIYTSAYFPEVKDVPAGLNFYKEQVYALKIYGEIAIIYTANDYGDMWQVGIDSKGQIDTRRNEKQAFVALNPTVWDNRETYLRNISPQSLRQTYKFGTNMVIHLLTRWEEKLHAAATL